MSKKFLEFVDQGKIPGRSTKFWWVKSANSGQLLGEIKYFVHWRKYIFQPGGVDPAIGVIFDDKCLTEIAEFCRQVNQQKRLRGSVK